MERLVLGPDPNHDLLRAVKVRDSEAVPLKKLEVGLVWTYTIRNQRLVEKQDDDGDYRAFIEWLPQGAELAVEILVDDTLFGPAADIKLHFSPAQKQTIGQLAQTCNDYARSLIQAEKEHFARHEMSGLRDYYTALEKSLGEVPGGAFLVNVGWGAGWEMKTIGSLLPDALGNNWRRLRKRYGLGQKPGTRQIDWACAYPKTRRLAYDRGVACWPMGWALLVPQGKEAPAPPRAASMVQKGRARAFGDRVTVKVLARHEKGPKGSFFVQEEGQPRGILGHGTPPAQLPEVGELIFVYINSLDPRSPQYRWDPPPPPAVERGRGGRGRSLEGGDNGDDSASTGSAPLSCRHLLFSSRESLSFRCCILFRGHIASARTKPPNAKAQPPGPPQQPWNSQKPKWRPRSAATPGSAFSSPPVGVARHERPFARLRRPNRATPQPLCECRSHATSQTRRAKLSIPPTYLGCS